MRSWTHEDWVEFHKNKGARSTVRYLDWLLKGCAICGATEWDLTNDGWCYCHGCNKGYTTDGIWTNRPLSFLDKDGIHCFWCKGSGLDREDPSKACDECRGVG